MLTLKVRAPFHLVVSSGAISRWDILQDCGLAARLWIFVNDGGFQMFKRILFRGIPAGFLLVSASSLLAQDYRGKIAGTITDQSQSAVPDATVTLHNSGTGVQTVRKTGQNGF